MKHQTSSKLYCAIYTRKSVEEGLVQQYNTLDAQFDACKAYIDSQRHAGWHFKKRYAYYVCGQQWIRQSVLDTLVVAAFTHLKQTLPIELSASLIEYLVNRRVTVDNITPLLHKVILTDAQLIIWIKSTIDAPTLMEPALPDDSVFSSKLAQQAIGLEQLSDSHYVVMKVNIKVNQCHGRTIIKGHYQKQSPNPEIVAALVQGWHERQLIQQGLGMEVMGKRLKQTKNVVRSRLLMAYLSPNIMKKLLSGAHSASLLVTDVYKIAKASHDWTQQEALFSEYSL